MATNSPTCHALLVDFDGVLRYWPNNAHLESACGLPIGALHKAAFEPGLLARVITGRITDGAWRKEVSSALSTHVGRAQAESAVRQWSEVTGMIDRQVLSLLVAAKEQIRLVLVTNATSRLGADLAVLGLGDFFHAIVSSSDVGAQKPEQAFFKAALAAARTTVEFAIFVDDSSENVAAARQLGIRSHVFSGFAAMRGFLQENGVALTGPCSDRD